MDKLNVLFITDDPRTHSGVANVSRNIIKYTKYINWVVLGQGANYISSRTANTENNFSKELDTKNEVDIFSVKSFTDSRVNYQYRVKELIENRDIDRVLFMGDLHNFDWLFDIERGIRKQCPLIYYHVWDNNPTPTWNKPYYDACDAMACASTLTYRCVKETTGEPETRLILHGVDTSVFKDLNLEKEDDITRVLWVNEAQRRKNPLGVLNVFKEYNSRINSNSKLILRTNPVRSEYNLPEAAKTFGIPNDKIEFIYESLSEASLNELYNKCDVTISPAIREGFGLTTLESVAAGTPSVFTETGGLRDQRILPHSYQVSEKYYHYEGDSKIPIIAEEYPDINAMASGVKWVLKENVKNKLDPHVALKNLNFTAHQMASSFDKLLREIEKPELKDYYILNSKI